MSEEKNSAVQQSTVSASSIPESTAPANSSNVSQNAGETAKATSPLAQIKTAPALMRTEFSQKNEIQTHLVDNNEKGD